MQTYPMITDGGPHPPDKWAAMTATRIIEDIVPKVVTVDDATHDVAKSTHPKVAEFRKALGKYEGWLREYIEVHHATIQSSARGGKIDSVMMDTVVDSLAKEMVDGAKQFHVGMHAHLSADSAMAAVVERLRTDFGSIIHIEHSWKRDGYTVDESHRAVKAGPA